MRLLAVGVCLGLLLVPGRATAQPARPGGPFSRVTMLSDTGPQLRAGTGSPEGVVTAPVGSVYLRTDGGAGSSVYFKESGSGNTGWSTGALGGGGGGSSHNLLSATHTDTSASAAVRGAIIVGNSSPAWSRSVPTVAGQVPRYNGTDTQWSLDGSLLEDLNASELTGGSVPDARLSVNVSLFGASVDNSEITAGTITFAKWASNSCSTNQIAKYNGSAWACAADETGVGGGSHSILSITHSDTVADTLVAGDILFANGSDLLERLPVGTNGDVLTLAAGLPSWAAPSGGASSSASYITKVAEAGLSNEFALGSLATGLLKNITTTGVPVIATAATDYVAPGSITTSGLTQATARLLGRTTASSGAVEEITVGAGLSLSAGSLTATGSNVCQQGQFPTNGTPTNSSTSLTVDWNNGRLQLIALTGSPTLTFSNPVAGCTYQALFVQGAGPYTITWPASVKWENNTAPIITTVNAEMVYCTFVYTTIGSDGYAGFCTTDPIPQP